MNASLARKRSMIKKRLSEIQNLGVLVIIFIFIIAVIVSSGSKFFTANNITNLLRSVAVTGITASAVTLVMVTGSIDLSLGWMVGFTAVITGVHSNSLISCIALSLGAGAICGAVNGFLVGVIKLNAFITTLGTMYIFKGVTMLYSNGQLVTAATSSNALRFVGQGYFLGVPVPIWIFIAVAVLFWFLLKRTSFGTRLYSVGSNPVCSHFSGVSSAKSIMTAYVLAGFAAGLAGVVLYSKVMSVQPYSGVGMEFEALTAVVLGGTSVTGGKGNVLGTVLGVIFVGILSNGFTLMGLGANAQYITQGLILLAAMRADVVGAGGLKNG